MANTKPAPRAKIVEVEYFFCRNPKCNYHASFLLGTRPESARLVVDDLCPQCGVGKIDLLKFKQKSDVPLTADVTAQALPAPPYGGLVLQFGDKDDGLIFEGTPQGDPRHSGAHYVGELQRDLLRLAYYGPARGGETLGVFSTMLLGGVLDLKRHLVKFYGVTGSTDFTAVQSGAAASDKPAIFFPTGGLSSPSEVYASVNAWTKLLGPPSTTANLVVTFEKWAALWERLKQSGLDDSAAGLQALRDQIAALQASRDRFKSEVPKAAKEQTALATRLTGLRAARSGSKLTEAQVSGVETALDTLLADVNALGPDLGAARDAVKALDAKLPLASPAASEPAPAALTVTPSAPADSTLDARFDRVAADDASVKTVVAAQTALTTFLDRKISDPKKDVKASPQKSFAGREAQFEKDLGTRQELGDLLVTTLTSLADEMSAATQAAALINAQPAKGTPTGAFVTLRKNALDRSTFWVQAGGPPPPGSSKPVAAGTVPGLLSRMTDLEARFASEGVPLPPQWAPLKSQLGSLGPTITAYHDEIDKSDVTTMMDAYVALLRSFGRVDAATARYIRGMVTDGKLGARLVFRTPMDAELVPFDFNAEIDGLVAQTATESGRADAPAPIVRFIFDHESGASHTRNFDGRTFVKLGIDWATPGDRSHFVERATGGRFSFSRGWGISQTTFFDDRVRIRLTDGLSATPPAPVAQTADTDVEMHSGVPFSPPDAAEARVPFVLASAAANAKTGINLYIGKFRATRAKRECTFKVRHDCRNCTKNLNVGSEKLDDKGKPLVKGGMKFFNEEEGDFERVLVNGFLQSHRFRTLDRVKALVTSGDYTIPGKTADTVGESERLEFPCSWLTAITMYAGAGEIAWYYALHGVFKLQR